jgi:transposase-like protein
MGRKPVFRQDVSRTSCGSHHVVKCGRPLGRQKCLCGDCGKCLLGDASHHHHHHSRKLREEALRMYANGNEYEGYF